MGKNKFNTKWLLVIPILAIAIFALFIASSQSTGESGITNSELELITMQHLAEIDADIQKVSLVSRYDSYYSDINNFAVEAIFDCWGIDCKGDQLLVYISKDRKVLSVTRWD